MDVFLAHAIGFFDLREGLVRVLKLEMHERVEVLLLTVAERRRLVAINVDHVLHALGYWMLPEDSFDLEEWIIVSNDPTCSSWLVFYSLLDSIAASLEHRLLTEGLLRLQGVVDRDR